jgi:amino acid transporter
LTFWAYAGFELAVLPAGEVRKPSVTLPRGLILGMAVATLFYLLTAFAVVVALPWQEAAVSPRPLTDAIEAILAGLGLPTGVGPAIMSLGGLVSILGVFDVFTLSVARLSYALANDGIFPTPFALVHPAYQTPYVGIFFQAVTGLAASLLFDLSSLIAISVFFLGICYVLTALSAIRLVGRAPNGTLRVPALRPVLALAALGGAYLSTQVALNLVVIGVAIMLLGVGLYALRRHAWRRWAEVQRTVVREEHRFERQARHWGTWLMHFTRRA